MALVGRRRPDTYAGMMPDDVRAGDYWKVLDRSSGEPRHVTTNLVGTVWMVAAPLGEEGFGLGRLEFHTVREHEDGTISILPGDGGSNSVLVKRAGREYHGFIRRGVWD